MRDTYRRITLSSVLQIVMWLKDTDTETIYFCQKRDLFFEILIILWNFPSKLAFHFMYIVAELAYVFFQFHCYYQAISKSLKNLAHVRASS